MTHTILKSGMKINEMSNTRKQKYGICVKSLSREHNKNSFHVAKWLRRGKSLEEILKIVEAPYTST